MPDLRSELSSKYAPPRRTTETPPPAEPPKEGITRNRLMVEPVFVAKLLDLVGADRAAEMTGYSASGLRRGVSQGEIGATVEILSRRIVKGMESRVAKPQPKTLLIRVPHDKVAAVQPFLDALGISATDLSEVLK